MKKVFLILMALIVVGVGIKVSQRYQFNPYYWYVVQSYKQEIKIPADFVTTDGLGDPHALIAHGGGVGSFVYTNSVQAVNDSLNKRFTFIELDLLKTSDGHLIGGHDWISFKRMVAYGDLKDQPLSFEEAKNNKVNGKWDPISAENIRHLMERYPNWILVTDKIQDFDLLLKEVPFPDRLVVEVFSVEDYVRALHSGIKFPMFSAKNVSYAKIAKIYGFPIIAVNIRRMFKSPERSEMLEDFVAKGVGVWGYYTTFKQKDDKEFLRQNLGRTLSKVYTDSLCPDFDPQ